MVTVAWSLWLVGLLQSTLLHLSHSMDLHLKDAVAVVNNPGIPVVRKSEAGSRKKERSRL